MKGKSTESFLSVLDIILRHEETSEGDIFAWQNVISSIRRNTLPHIQDNEVLFHAEDLCNQARAMIGERALRALEYRRLKTEQQAAVLNDISQALAIGVYADIVSIYNVSIRSGNHNQNATAGITGNYISFCCSGTADKIGASSKIDTYAVWNRAGAVGIRADVIVVNGIVGCRYDIDSIAITGYDISLAG